VSRPDRRARADYRHFQSITTRWMDNDAYGHVNNVVYYSFFDTVVNTFLIAKGVLDVAEGPVIGFVVETGCHYFAPLAYPRPVEAGLRVTSIGRSSVRYEVGLFDEGSDAVAAQGHFIHVYVDRKSNRPVSLPAPLRAALEPLLVET
jgi:acyl-CoA thioester hydrolase